MTKLIAPECQCRYSTSLGEKKPETCTEHGNRFVLASSVGVGASEQKRRSHQAGKSPSPGLDSSAPRRRSLKRSQPKRDWSLAIAKRDEESDLCRVCAATGTQCAHVLGRKYDQPIAPGSKTLLVLPDRIVPLCGALTGHGCHERYDAHELDLLPYLTTAEQAQAVLDAGGIISALRRISPDHPEETEALK